MNEMLEKMIQNNELNAEQLEKLKNMETKGYLNKLPADKEGVVDYLNNHWRIVEPKSSLEGNGTADEVVEESKKTRTPISAKEKRIKIVSKIAKYEELLAKAKQELIDFDTKEDLAIIKGLTQEQREYLEQLKKN